jgi:hypothetical protein
LGWSEGFSAFRFRSWVIVCFALWVSLLVRFWSAVVPLELGCSVAFLCRFKGFRVVTSSPAVGSSL